MNVDVNVILNTLITTAGVLTAVGVIIGLFVKIHKWYLKQERQDDDIKNVKKENRLIFEGLLACLDGLEQLGANHTVPIAKEKLQNHLNERAHE